MSTNLATYIGAVIKKTLCFSNPAYLSLSQGQLVIELPEEGERPRTKLTRPIEDLGVMIIESPMVTFTSGLMTALLENNVAVITCDAKHMPLGLLMPLEANTIQSERFRNQINASLPLRKRLWQQTVQYKIRNQYKVLKRWNPGECECMDAWSRSVKSNDSENLEGRAAAFYWRNLFVNNPNFKRRSNDIEPNSLFNYGYAILRAVMARSLVGSGLLPTLGIHHQNRYNAYCLADDIMEPYRPYVDNIVMELIDSKGCAPPLTPEVKKQLLQIPVCDVEVKGLRRPLMIAAGITSASLAQCFSGESKAIDYPEM